jgi:hypothetical protein
MNNRMVFDREYITVVLKQIEAALSRGKDISVACGEADITPTRYYRWRQQYADTVSEQMPDFFGEKAREVG